MLEKRPEKLIAHVRLLGTQIARVGDRDFEIFENYFVEIRKNY